MAELSSSGKKFLAALAFIFVFDIAAVALSARINILQEFFFMADLFPLGLSIATLIMLLFLFIFNFALLDSFLVRAPFQVGTLLFLSVLWLAFNAFSTSRWSHVPMNCASIPANYAAERTWCQDVQGLKAVVWIEWLALLGTSLITLRHTLTQHTRGNTHVWAHALARYDPAVGARSTGRDSEFLQFEKVETMRSMRMREDVAAYRGQDQVYQGQGQGQMYQGQEVYQGQGMSYPGQGMAY